MKISKRNQLDGAKPLVGRDHPYSESLLTVVLTICNQCRFMRKKVAVRKLK